MAREFDLEPMVPSDEPKPEPVEEVIATVYAALPEFGIVRLRAGNRLFGFGPRVPGAPRYLVSRRECVANSLLALG